MSTLYIHIADRGCQAVYLTETRTPGSGVEESAEAIDLKPFDKPLHLSSRVLFGPYDEICVAFSPNDAPPEKSQVDASSWARLLPDKAMKQDSSIARLDSFDDKLLGDEERFARYLAVLVQACLKHFAASEKVQKLYIASGSNGHQNEQRKAVGQVARSLKIDEYWWLCAIEPDFNQIMEIHGQDSDHTIGAYAIQSITFGGESKETCHEPFVSFQTRPAGPDCDELFSIDYVATMPSERDGSGATCTVRVPGKKWDNDEEYLVEMHQFPDESYSIQARIGLRPVALKVGQAPEGVKLDLLDGRAYRLTFSEEHAKECALRRQIKGIIDKCVYLFGRRPGAEAELVKR